MDYVVKNGSWRDKAFKVVGGLVIVPAGGETKVEDAVELSESQIKALAKDDCVVEVADAAPAKKPRSPAPAKD